MPARWSDDISPAAEERDRGGNEQRADDRGVEQDAGAEAGGDHLRLRRGGACHRDEREEEDQGGARDEPTRAANALDDGGLGGPRRVVGLAHPGEDEDLVVHREAEQEREHHQR
jgi:hypothetical protein